MTVRKEVEGGSFYAPVLCKNWSCDVCGPMRAAWLKRQLMRLVEDGTLSSFWTLTVRTSSCDPEESLYFVAGAWNILRGSLRRHYGAFEYCWTRETTKRGYGHLHLLTNLALEVTQLSSMWLEATGSSWVVDVQEVQGARAGSYLAKYCVSEARSRPVTTNGERTRLKVFGKSRGIVFEPFVEGTEGACEIIERPWREVRAALARDGAIRHEKVIGAPWLLANDQKVPR